MKKNLIILSAMVAAALASCSTEVTPAAEELGQEIGFKAVAQKATKADGAIITSAVFPEDNTFKVWGFYDKDATTAAVALGEDSTPNFMNGVVISYTTNPVNTTKAWRNADKSYYWPQTGAIGFYAIAPSVTTPAVAGIKYGKLDINDYTITDQTRTTDLMYGYAVGMNRTDALPLVFNHALSQVEFKIKTDADYSAEGVKFSVTKVVIKKIDLSGDFSYSQPTTAAWTDNDNLAENFQYSATTQEALKDAATYDAPVVMIPQNWRKLEADGTTVNTEALLDIEYSLKQVDESVQTGLVTVKLPWSENGSMWVMGKKYVYTLNFKLNEILFSPTVTEWVSVDATEVTLF